MTNRCHLSLTPLYCPHSHQTIHTASGERQVLTYNFCANSQLYGYEQDVRTGGQCSYTEDQLPDERCMFYVDQQTQATASYMALPYLDRYVCL